MTETALSVQAELERLRQENRWLRVDSSKRAFYALNRIINQQVDILNDFNIKANMDGKKSENAAFERAQSLWKELPKLTAELNELRDKLKIDGEVPEEEVLLPISPEMIANA